MMWKELNLTEPALLEFPDSSEATLFYSSRKLDREWVGHVRVVIPGRAEIELTDVADDGETTEYARVLVVSGDAPDKVFMLGGPVAYRLSSAGAIEERVQLHREREFEEYWDTELVDAEHGIVVIYEGGVFLLNPHLRLAWHSEKYFDDRLEEVSDEVMYFLNGQDERWGIDLSSGIILSPI